MQNRGQIKDIIIFPAEVRHILLLCQEEGRFLTYDSCVTSGASSKKSTFEKTFFNYTAHHRTAQLKEKKQNSEIAHSMKFSYFCKKVYLHPKYIAPEFGFKLYKTTLTLHRQKIPWIFSQADGSNISRNRRFKFTPL